jgi:hypothetical protein
MPRISRNLATAIVLLTFAAIPSSAHAATRACSNQTGADVVTTRNTSCSEARKLIRLWVQGVRRDNRYNRNVARWRAAIAPRASKATRWCVAKDPASVFPGT